MHSLVSARVVLLFLASLAFFGVSYYLIRKNSRSRKGGDDYVRRKRRKTLGHILLFPAVLLLLLAASDEEMSSDSGMEPIDPVAAAAAQAYVPPVLSKPTESPLTPTDTWKTRLPSTNGIAYESAPAKLAPSTATTPPVTSPYGVPVTIPTATTASPTRALSKAEQLDADLAAATAKIAANPKDSDAYGARGNIYAAKRNWEDAERDYHSVLALDGTNTRAKFNLAEMSFMEKKFAASKTAFVALEQDPDVGDLAAYKAFLSDLFGEQQDAASKELDAFNQVGANASYYFANAAWSINHHKPEDARTWLKSAGHIYPPEKFRMYATTLYEMGYLPLPAPTN